MLTSTHPIDWATVVEVNRDWIGRLIAARTGAPDAIDDVMQEVSLAVTRSGSRPTCIDEVAPWLCKIVVRQCALIVRQQVRQRRKLDGYHRAREPADSQTGDPIFWLLHEEQREIIRGELRAMDAASRQLLIWKYLNGIGYEDIGIRLGVSRHVAEYRVIEAKRELRSRLQARGIHQGETP
jgi:RNA polymerase sigma factor (sigma-70 family)